MSVKQKEIFPNIFTSQCTIYPPVNTVQHAIAKTHCWITIYWERQVLFTRGASQTFITALNITVPGTELAVILVDFCDVLMTHPSTYIGPYKKRRTVNTLIIPRVPKIQFQLHTR